MLRDGRGGELHLNQAVEGWLIPGRNPFGLYLYTENVDKLVAKMGCTAEDKPWGMYEFAVSDPDQTLIRVGWPSRLRPKRPSWPSGNNTPTIFTFHVSRFTVHAQNRPTRSSHPE